MEQELGEKLKSGATYLEVLHSEGKVGWNLWREEQRGGGQRWPHGFPPCTWEWEGKAASVHENFENVSSLEKFEGYWVITALISRRKIKVSIQGRLTWLAPSAVRTWAPLLRTEYGGWECLGLAYDVVIIIFQRKAQSVIYCIFPPRRQPRNNQWWIFSTGRIAQVSWFPSWPQCSFSLVSPADISPPRQPPQPINAGISWILFSCVFSFCDLGYLTY